MDIITYNNTLSSIINKYKPIVADYLHYNENELNYFYNEVFQLINPYMSNRKNNFIKSFYLQLWNSIQSYHDSRNGLLFGNSGNCKFALADLVISNSPNIFKGFFKVVNLQSQFHHMDGIGYDLLIADILSAIIIERLKNTYSNIQHHFPKYIDASLGYYKIQSIGEEYWSFNECIYTNPNSIHNYNSVINRQPVNYTDECIIMIYNAVNLISLEDIFVNYKNNNNLHNFMCCIDVLNDYVNLCNLIKELGTYYGFIHNDLHAKNIIYNIDTKKLMIIDLGRVSFRKYIDTDYADINLITKYQYYKLGYADIYSDIQSIDKYSNLYTNRRLFNHRLSEPLPHNPLLYYGFIYDLITLTLQFYIKIVFFFTNANPIFMQHINQYLMNIVNLNYNGDINNLCKPRCNYDIQLNTVNIESLFINFNNAKNFIDSLNESHNIASNDIHSIKQLFHEITNGLLITAIFFHSNGKGTSITNPIIIDHTINNRIIYWRLIIQKGVNLNVFYIYLKSLYDNVYYKTELNKIDYIAMLFSTPILTGGKKMKSFIKSPVKNLKKYSIKKPELFNTKNQTTVDIETLTANYEKLFTDKYHDYNISSKKSKYNKN